MSTSDNKISKGTDTKNVLKTIYTAPKKVTYPKLDNVDDNVFMDKDEVYRYLVIEIVKGTSFCLVHKKEENDFQVYFHKREPEKDKNDFCSLDANVNAESLPLYKPLRDLAEELGKGQVNFVIFLEYVTFQNQKCNYILPDEDNVAKILIYDIFINDNWIPHDLLKELCDRHGLRTMPVLYDGKYDENIFNKFLYEVPSHFNKAEKYGLLIKSQIEDIEYNKRIAKIMLNKKFKGDLILYSSLSDEEIERKVKSEITKNFYESRRANVDFAMKNLFPNLYDPADAKQAGKMLSHAVKHSLRTYFYYSVQDIGGFKSTEFEKKKINKELNKQLSNIFIKRYKFFKKEAV